MGVYGPAPIVVNTDDAMGYISEFEVSGYAADNGLYIDDFDTDYWRCTGLRFAGVNLVGAASITSAFLTFSRNGLGDAGANGVVRLRCEASQTPATFSVGSKPGQRSLRAVNVDYDFPIGTSPVSVDVTALLSDLLAAGYSYHGGADSIVFVLGASIFGLAPVSYRGLGYDSSHGSDATTLTVTYAAASAVSPALIPTFIPGL